jgi:hypothetical protein
MALSDFEKFEGDLEADENMSLVSTIQNISPQNNTVNIAVHERTKTKKISIS